MGWDLAALPFDITEYATHVRMLDTAGKEPARLHHLIAGVVHRGSGVIHGTNN